MDEEKEEKVICDLCGKDITNLKDKDKHLTETCPQLPKNIEKRKKKDQIKRKEITPKIEVPTIKTEEIEKKVSETISAEFGMTIDDQSKKIDDLTIKLTSYQDLLENLQEELKDLEFLKGEAGIKNKIVILIKKLDNKNIELEKIYKTIEVEAKSRKIFQLSEDKIINLIKQNTKVYRTNGKVVSHFPDKNLTGKLVSKIELFGKEIHNSELKTIIVRVWSNRQVYLKGYLELINRYPELVTSEDSTTHTLDSKTLMAIRQYLTEEIEKSEIQNL